MSATDALNEAPHLWVCWRLDEHLLGVQGNWNIQDSAKTCERHTNLAIRSAHDSMMNGSNLNIPL